MFSGGGEGECEIEGTVCAFVFGMRGVDFFRFLGSCLVLAMLLISAFRRVSFHFLGKGMERDGMAWIWGAGKTLTSRDED